MNQSTTLNQLKQLQNYFTGDNSTLSTEALQLLVSLELFAEGKKPTLPLEAFLLFFNEETQAKFLALGAEDLARVEQGLRTIFHQQQGDVLEFYLIDFDQSYNNQSSIYKFFTYHLETKVLTPCKDLDYKFEEGATFYFSSLIKQTVFKEETCSYRDIYHYSANPLNTFYFG